MTVAEEHYASDDVTGAKEDFLSMLLFQWRKCGTLKKDFAGNTKWSWNSMTNSSELDSKLFIQTL